MKKILYIFAAISFILSSCQDEENVLSVDFDTKVHFENPSVTFTPLLVQAGTGETAAVTIPVTVLGEAPTTALNVSVEATEASTAIEGVHYTLNNETVVIGAGEYSGTIGLTIILDGFESSADTKTLLLQIGGPATEGVADINTSIEVSLGYTCVSELGGTYTVTGEISVSDFGPQSYTYESELVDIGNGVYEVEDFTGGMWANDPYASAYGTTARATTLTDVCGVITVATVSNGFNGGEDAQATTSVSYNPETGVISWAWQDQQYGETGVTTYTPISE